MRLSNISALLPLVIVLCFPMHISAVRAYPYPVEVKQPSGETITIQAHGDEFFHYVTTAGGYVVAVDNDGYFTFAEINNDGNIQQGKVRVSGNTLRSSNNSFVRADSPEFIQKIEQSVLSRRIDMQNKIAGLRSASKLRSAAGDTKSLIILAGFPDKPFSFNDQAFSNMLNQSGYRPSGAVGFTGSVRDYFINNSDGAFNPKFEVYGPVQLPHDMAFYGANDLTTGIDINAEQMIVDACVAANNMYPGLNFADFPRAIDVDENGNIITTSNLDNVCVIYAGYNEAENFETLPNTIWPHQYYLQFSNIPKSERTIDGVILDTYMCTSELRGKPLAVNMAGIGTFTHEYSHILGMPDLYDANGDVDGTVITEPNFWSLMSSGNYLNNGNTPPTYSAIERAWLGWMELWTWNSGNWTIHPITSSSQNKVLGVETPTEGDFFTVEVRKKEGWDSFLPGEGMLIYHIDMSDYSVQTTNYGDLTIGELWGGGIPNIIGDRPGLKLMTANKEVMTLSNGSCIYQNYSGHPFPGATGVTSISDNTNPGFKSWKNENSGASITNIVKNFDGSVSFRYSNTSTDIKENTLNSPFAFSNDNIIYFKNISGSTQVNIYDIRGSLYLSKNISDSDNQEIAVPGIYIVKLQTNNEVSTYKIMIK